jgi:hypothetical protein
MYYNNCYYISRVFGEKFCKNENIKQFRDIK